jgi:hypothetical protein
METILKRKVAWPMSNELAPDEYEINRWINKLDEVAITYTARWGISRLERLVNPALQAKWEQQLAKLDDAIQRRDLAQVRDLADGTIRGYRALEVAAVAEGHKPNPVDQWDVRSPDTGRCYRICKTVTDARAAGDHGTGTYSLDEIARILDKLDLSLRNPIIAPAAPQNPAKPFDWKKGDELPGEF